VLAVGSGGDGADVASVSIFDAGSGWTTETVTTEAGAHLADAVSISDALLTVGWSTSEGMGTSGAAWMRPGA
jgi:hypothetical protein